MLPTLNPDGVSVKGCTIIYAPAGQAGEYSALATNPYRGCGHQCAYCYVPGVLHITRKEFDAGAIPRDDFIRRLIGDAEKYQALGITEQVMESFTTDVYHPGDTALTRETHKILQAYGMGICPLTKGGRRALRDLDLFRPGRDAFASTLTSLEDTFSLKWERAAALPGDRIDTLREFHDAGIFTWVSLEPVLDTAATLEIIRRTHRFVDLYKVGRVNYTGLTKTTDWKQFTADVLAVLEEVGAKHYIKRDLQPYLPEGYDNPMRVDQFRRDPFSILADDPPLERPADRDLIEITTGAPLMKSFDEFLNQRGAVTTKEGGRKKGVCKCGKYAELTSRGRCDACRKREDDEDRSGMNKHQQTRYSVFFALIKQYKRLGWSRREIADHLQQPRLKQEFDCIRQYVSEDAFLAVAAVGESAFAVDPEQTASTPGDDEPEKPRQLVDAQQFASTPGEVDDELSRSTPDRPRDQSTRVDAQKRSSTPPERDADKEPLWDVFGGGAPS